ncbi:MAG: hypothetical protein LIO77_05080 [Rikenellaceae bacterium]|nr:hypothetical protein [Rikenellaceae bacterium]
MSRVKGFLLSLFAAALSIAALSGQRPVPLWFKTPDGIGIVRYSDIESLAPVLLCTGPDITTVYDTVRFHLIAEPYPPLPEPDDHMIILLNEDSADSIVLRSKGYWAPEKFERLEEQLYSGNRSGQWEYSATTAIHPLDWYPGHSDFGSRDLGDRGLARLQAELTLRAVRHIPGWVEVVVNENTGATAYIAVDERAGIPVVVTWEYYLTHVVSCLFSPSVVEVHNRPKDKSPHKIIDTSQTQIIEVRGQWVLLGRYTSDGAVERVGWAKWHDGDRVLVRVREFLWI